MFNLGTHNNSSMMTMNPVDGSRFDSSPNVRPVKKYNPYDDKNKIRKKPT